MDPGFEKVHSLTSINTVLETPRIAVILKAKLLSV